MSQTLEMMDLYNKNPDFKNYVDRYAKTKGLIFPEDAFKHMIVIETYKYYISKGVCNEPVTSKNKDILCNQCDRDA